MAAWYQRRYGGRLSKGLGPPSSPPGKGRGGPPSGRGPGRGRGRPGRGPGGGGPSNPWPNPTFSNVRLIEGFEDKTDTTFDAGQDAAATIDLSALSSITDATLFEVQRYGKPTTAGGLVSTDYTDAAGLDKAGSDIACIEMWVYPTVLDSDDGNNKTMATVYYAGGNERNWRILQYTGATWALQIFPNSGSSATNTLFDSTGELVKNVWNFVGCAHEGDDWYVFHGVEGGKVTIDSFTNSVRPAGVSTRGMTFFREDTTENASTFLGAQGEFRYTTGEAFWPTESGVYDVPASPWPRS